MRPGRAVERVLQLSGIRIRCLQWGDETGEPVVLVHGLTGCADVWSEVAEGLAARGLRVVAPDLRGHGRSDKPEDYSLSSLSGDIIGVIERLALGPTHLVGHSVGASVAWEVAASRPELVRRLVIEDQHPDVSPGDWTYWREWAASWPARFESRDQAIEYLRANGRSLAWWLPSLVPLPGGEWGWAFDARAVLEISRQIAMRGAWERLALVSAPTLLVRGSESTHLRPEVAERMVRTIRDCRLLVVPGADHWVHRQTGPYVEAVATFLMGR